MHDTVLAVLTGLATFLIGLLLASPTQWRARNTGTLLNIGWLLAGNLIFLVNTLVWRDSVDNTAPVWCDISVKVQAGLHTGISGASLCITRRLANIATSRAIRPSRGRNVDLYIDLACGLGVPAMVMAFSYIIQPQRFNLVEGYGCEYRGYSSIPAIFLHFIWPLLLSTISAVYGAIAIYYFVSKRLEFQTLLKTSRSGLDTSHFVRLLCIASIDLAVAVPFDIYLMVRASEVMLPWISWEHVHEDWGRIGQVPASLWLTLPRWILDGVLPRYVLPTVAFAFFALIGVTEDTVGEYVRFYRFIQRHTFGPTREALSLPQPVTLGSKVSRPDGQNMMPAPETAQSGDGTFGLHQHYGATSPKFPTGRGRVAVKVERQVV